VKIGSISRLLLVAYFLEVGLVLVVVPWSTFWERNFFAEALPALNGFLKNNFVRGAISGLGIVNLGVGLIELANMMFSRHLAGRRETSLIFRDDSPGAP
jgi:hypothetical protein